MVHRHAQDHPARSTLPLSEIAKARKLGTAAMTQRLNGNHSSFVALGACQSWQLGREGAAAIVDWTIRFLETCRGARLTGLMITLMHRCDRELLRVSRPSWAGVAPDPHFLRAFCKNNVRFRRWSCKMLMDMMISLPPGKRTMGITLRSDGRVASVGKMAHLHAAVVEVLGRVRGTRRRVGVGVKQKGALRLPYTRTTGADCSNPAWSSE